eukprot:jgi/Chrzof1/4006/Cz13g16250.t1
MERQGTGTASVRASVCRTGRLEPAEFYRTTTILLVANAVVPTLPLPPHVITVLRGLGNLLVVVSLALINTTTQEYDRSVLVEVDGDRCMVDRASLVKALGIWAGPDAQRAKAAISQAICSIWGMEYSESMSLQFSQQGLERVTSPEDGRRGIFDLLISAETIVLNTKGC